MANPENSRVSGADRHSRDCAVCNHTDREGIETAFVDWKPQATIAREFKIPRSSLWRHAKTFQLFERRDANLRGALGQIIERGVALKPTPAATVHAIAVLAKLDGEGHSVERVEMMDPRNMDSLFARMTADEMTEYASTGTLPRWWPR